MSLMPEPRDLSTPLAWAMAYARIGWHVLPLEPRAKQPLGRLVPRGMLDATTDEDVIARWWKAAPAAGVGIALAPSGLVALDIDPRNGGTETFEALQADHGSLRSEVMAYTGGGGEHHVFVVPPGTQVSLPGTLGPGVDVKANGYIVVEPSIHPSGKQYGWEASSSPLDGVAPSPLPDWLRSLRVELQRRAPVPGDVPVNPQQARDVREALWLLNADDYHEWIQAGMALHSTSWGHPAYAMWCAWSQQSDKFDATVCRQKWESFREPGSTPGKAITVAWIFGKAQAAGWVNPQARVKAAPQVEEPPPPQHPDDEREGDADPLPLLSLAELKSRAGAISWVIKHAIPAESMGMFFGGSGTFKSFIALDMALHVAHGLPWLGKKTKQGPVIFIAAEGGAGLWKRIEAWHRDRGINWQDAPVYVVPVALDLAQDCYRVRQAASALGVEPLVVVIDTLSQTFGGEENSATEVSGYLREIGLQFRALWQCAVVLIHHTGHQATERPRGSSTMRANLDFMFGVFRDEREMLATLSNQKQKDGELLGDETFALAVEELGTDEDGEKITSLVARHLTSAEEVTHAMEVESKAGRGGKNQLLLRLMQNGQEEKALRSAFYDACDIEQPDAKRQAYFRAKSWAIKAGFLEVSEGYVITLKKGY